MPPFIDVKSTSVDLTGQDGWHCQQITPADLPDNTNVHQLVEAARDMWHVVSLIKRIIQTAPK